MVRVLENQAGRFLSMIKKYWTSMVGTLPRRERRWRGSTLHTALSVTGIFARTNPEKHILSQKIQNKGISKSGVPPSFSKNWRTREVHTHLMHFMKITAWKSAKLSRANVALGLLTTVSRVRTLCPTCCVGFSTPCDSASSAVYLPWQGGKLGVFYT